jgi:hypothetical protein
MALLLLQSSLEVCEFSQRQKSALGLCSMTDIYCSYGRENGETAHPNSAINDS